MTLLRAAWHRLEEGLMAFLLVFMTLVTFYQVVLRYVFNSGLLWGQEAVLYAFGWLVLLGLAYGVRTRAHLGIDIAVKALSPSLRRTVGLIAVALCMVYAGLLAYGSWIYMDTLRVVGIEAQDIPVERWLLLTILPFGFLLLLLRLCTEAKLILTGEVQGFEIADEAGDALRELHDPRP
ncbi:TRAP transporter small permease [Roseomonas sp. E05]|uniref:TRAP transporter small permease n=1 Tax=Roseomonas sp. E05 TaxID=3046310 RepID=UPI0024BB3ED9|nr:TRAP transporter small permease [Roseomonas sp. E05]MDJ0389153.1 TRAP transporter small permease [Roseomonas sp. E05]